MCEVIVVYVESFRSTIIGHDAYMFDHCLGYHHNYLLFYQLLNSNLSTHRMLFSREKASSENYGPGSIFYHIKILKIPYCNFLLFILFCIFIRSIYRNL